MSLTDRPVDRLGDEISGATSARTTQGIAENWRDPAEVKAEMGPIRWTANQAALAWVYGLLVWYAGRESVPKGTKTPLAAPLEPLQHITEGQS